MMRRGGACGAAPSRLRRRAKARRRAIHVCSGPASDHTADVARFAHLARCARGTKEGVTGLPRGPSARPPVTHDPADGAGR
jgi:hypothetical protein